MYASPHGELVCAETDLGGVGFNSNGSVAERVAWAAAPATTGRTLWNIARVLAILDSWGSSGIVEGGRMTVAEDKYVIWGYCLS